MTEKPPPAPPWVGLLTWLPLVAYFVIKYAIVGAANMSGQQSIMLIVACVLASFAISRFQKSYYSNNGPGGGTD